MLFYFETKSIESNTILKLFGHLVEKSQATDFLAAVHQEIENGNKNIVLDLTDLKYLNSTGINVFVNILTKVRKQDGELILYGVNKKINDLLIITKINSLFKVFNSEEEAVEHAKKS